MIRKIYLIVLNLSLVIFSYSQNTWERTYGIAGRFEDCYSVVSTYDGGFLLAINYVANNNPGNPQYCTWLLKTDINGIPLWSKYFYNTEFTFEIAHMDIDSNGYIITTGITTEINPYGDSFIMLLNPCGEKIWCKRLHYDNMNYGWKVKHHFSGNYFLYSRHASDNWLVERNQLWKFDTLGNILFCSQIVPEYDYPYMDQPEIYDFISTSDNCFLFSGNAYLQDTSSPQQWWRLQHLLVKTDSLGNEIWVIPDSFNIERVGNLISINEFNNNYYANGYKKDLIPRYQPYFSKISTNGTILLETIIHPDTLFTILTEINQADSIFYHSGQCFYTSSDPMFTGIFKTDSSGNLIASIENKNGAPIKGTFTHAKNNKFLVGGYAPYNFSNFNDVDAWAMKVNSALEYDTLYSFPFVYDSLCPYPIVTDTIDCDCDLITGFGEPIHVEERYQLRIYPNPANDRVKIQMNDRIGGVNNELLELLIYDLYGRKIYEKDFIRETGLDTGAWSPGIYVVVVEQNGSALAREKLVVL